MIRPALLLALGVCTACGGGTQAPKSGPPATDDQNLERTETTPSDTPVPGYGQQQPGYGTPAEPGGVSPSGTTDPATPAGPFAQAPPATLEEALSALDAAAGELSAAGTDCAKGCKALASMQRSSERICELNQPGDPGARCQKAKARVEGAREILERRCGSCEP